MGNITTITTGARAQSYGDDALDREAAYLAIDAIANYTIVGGTYGAIYGAMAGAIIGYGIYKMSQYDPTIPPSFCNCDS